MIGQFAELEGNFPSKRPHFALVRMHVPYMSVLWYGGVVFTVYGFSPQHLPLLAKKVIEFIGERLFMPLVVIPSLHPTLHRPGCIGHNTKCGSVNGCVCTTHPIYTTSHVFARPYDTKYSIYYYVAYCTH